MYASSCNTARGRHKIFELWSTWKFPKNSSRYLTFINFLRYLFICSIIHSFIYSFTHSFIQLLINVFIYSFIYLLVYLFIYLFTHLFVYLFMYSFTCPSIYSFTLFIYSFIFIDSIYSFILFIHLSLSLTGLPAFWYRPLQQKARRFKNDKFYNIWKEVVAAKLQPVLTNWFSWQTPYFLWGTKLILVNNLVDCRSSTIHSGARRSIRRI